MRTQFTREEWAALGVIDLHDNDDPTYDPDADCWFIDPEDSGDDVMGALAAYEHSIYGA